VLFHRPLGDLTGRREQDRNCIACSTSTYAEKGEDAERWKQLADLPRGIQALGRETQRHADVDDHQIRGMLADQLPKPHASIGLPQRLEPGACEQAGRSPAEQHIARADARTSRTVMSLNRRIVIASSQLAILIGTAFAILLITVSDMAASTTHARHAVARFETTSGFQKTLLHMETGVRGFTITGDELFLQPWKAAIASLPAQERALTKTADTPRQEAGAPDHSRDAGLRPGLFGPAGGGGPAKPGGAELVATAIANANARAELSASRARIVAASDDTRRRIERDLHDGIQQRLVALGLNLRITEENLPAELTLPRAQLSEISSGVMDALADLQETARGIHPAILTAGGLGPAIRGLARRVTIPVEHDVRVKDRLPDTVEVAAYYVVAEGLANAAKHAHATVIHIEAEVRSGHLHLSLRDDGVGGADRNGGSGLVGLTDRVEALNGTIVISSPVGKGTSLQVDLPLRTTQAALR
jgi:signal transduction histidine kinase